MGVRTGGFEIANPPLLTLSQLKIASQVCLLDDLPNPVRFVAGLDISFVEDAKEGEPNACTGIVVIDLDLLDRGEPNVVYSNFRMITLQVPYISGFLAFREADPLLELIEELRASVAAGHHNCFPQVLFIDGNGILHPRRCGVACVLGVRANIPSIGCAKKLLHLNSDFDKSVIRERCDTELKQPGDHFLLQDPPDGETVGAVLRSPSNQPNEPFQPIFVSPGHRLTLSTAVLLASRVSIFRVPEPIRQADLLSRAFLRRR